MSVKLNTFQEMLWSNPQIGSDLTSIRNWLDKQKHLPNTMTDHQIVTFLTSCSNSLEATKKCIDAFYTIKCSSPEFFQNRDPLSEDVQQAARVLDIVQLSATSPEGYRYIFSRLADFEPSHYNPDPTTKLTMMIVDAAVRFDALAPGIVFISDMAGSQFEHMTRGKISSIKKYMRYVQEAMPVKIKTVHLFNVSPVVHTIISFVRPFMSKDHFELINFHSGEQGMEELYKSVPKRILPKDYGGDDDTVEALKKKCAEQLVSYRDWFKEEEDKCYVDESKREGQTKKEGDFFGKNGSFKKLDLD